MPAVIGGSNWALGLERVTVLNSYYVLEPEVAGDFGPATILDPSRRPPDVRVLDYEFTVWLGDDLLTTHPCFIVTDRLRDALSNSGYTGFDFDEVITSVSEDFRNVCPNTELPHFSWWKICGAPGVDDVGLTIKDQRLVVSERLIALLRQFRIEHCLIRKNPYRMGQ